MIARCSCLLLLALGVGRGQSAPQLRGVMIADDHWLASLTLDEPPVQRWCAAGDSIGSFRVETVTRDTVTVLDTSGIRHSMILPSARVLNASAPPADPTAWRRWVNSRDNPMLLAPAEPPMPLRQWRDLPEAKRDEITEWYRRHGWSLSVALDAQGNPSVEFSPLQSAERQAIVAEKEHTFLLSLASEQRVLYNDSQHTRTAESAERFKASLDPMRRDAFERLRDFTEPLPAELRR